MKRPTTLLHRVLLDEGLQVGLTIERDVQEIERRYKHEGLSFLTITLPLLDDVLLKGLSQGRIVVSDFQGFKPRKRNESLPALLSGFFMRVFASDGHLLDDPCIDSIRAIHMITRAFKKLEMPCSSARIRAAFERYRSNDEGIIWTSDWCSDYTSILSSVSHHLWSDLEELSGKLYCFPGQFGSGATAEKLLFNERHTVRQWYSRSEPWFPSDYHATHNFSDGIEDIEFLGESDEIPVRVVQVPKTLKTPRTISVEPSFVMLMQQSIAGPLMEYLEGSSFPYNSIRFTDQTVNRRLAEKGSIDGSIGTIDLKDASDLVSNDLVKFIFDRSCPTFSGLIQGCRSRTARMPDGTVLTLRKFASMGSALCFPIEAMVFFTIVLTAMVKESGRVPSRSLLMSLAKDVAVYGDDIIVPVKMVPVVMDALESFGLKVNHSKSFSQGFFRESCGGDYYKGVDVTPTYVRSWDFTGSLREASHLVAYVSLSNQLYVKGLWHACQSVRDVIDSGKRQLPFSRYPSGYLHHASFTRSSGLVWSDALSGYRVRGFVPSAVKQADSPTNLPGFMLRTLLSSERRTVQRDYRSYLDCVLRPVSGCNRRFLRPGVETYLGNSLDVTPKDSGAFDYASMSNGELRSALRRGTPLRQELLNTAYTSVRAYTLRVKCRWTPAIAGINW